MKKNDFTVETCIWKSLNLNYKLPAEGCPLIGSLTLLKPGFQGQLSKKIEVTQVTERFLKPTPKTQKEHESS